MHYTQFGRAKASIPKEFREEFEDALIAQGKLLPLESSGDNPFSVFATEFRQHAKKQRAADDATLKSAEAKAQFRRDKKRPESPESS
jgi:hypothetical protein